MRKDIKYSYKGWHRTGKKKDDKKVASHRYYFAHELFSNYFMYENVVLFFDESGFN